MNDQNPWIPALTLFLNLIGGGLAGGWLGGAMAPETVFAVAASALMMPASLLVGLFLWMGTASLTLPFSILRGIHVWARKEPAPSAQTVPPGAFIFIPVSTIFCAMAGMAAGFAGNAWSVPLTLTFYIFVGLAYGVCLWRLAEIGYLTASDG